MVTLQLLPFKFAVFIAYIILSKGASLQRDASECSPCTSKDCISYASRILRNLKKEVDPCEDFFTFACGGYFEKFGKDDTRSVYDDTWYSLQILIKDLLENLNPGEGTPSKKLKIVYDTCMRKDLYELKAVSDAVDFINQVGIPKWPNVDSDFQFVQLSETLGHLIVYGEFAFITFKKTPYEYGDGLPPAIILPGNYLLSSKIKPKDVQNSVLRILSYFNVGKNESETMWRNFKEIEDIGIQLQNVKDESTNVSGCRDRSGRAYTSIKCSEEFNDNVKFLCNLWKSAVKIGNLDKYYSEDTIHISCHWNHFNYIENIFSRLVNISHTSLANFLSLRFFVNHLDDMNLFFHLTKKTYPEDKGSISKRPEPISRWEYCIGWMIKSMSLALGYEYTKEILTPLAENNALDMIQDYVQSLSALIESQSWIEQRVKFYLRRELEKLDIGFITTMEKFKNLTFISNYYKEFHPVKESFLKNILEFGKLSIIAKDKRHFNSFYSSSDPYTMDFGFALFMPPTYSHSLPKKLHYATLGSVIGHELSHNLKFYFDFVPLDDETENAMNKKMQCYVQQYSQFIMQKTGKTISSNEAKEEIIADNIGWQLTEKVLEHIIDSFNLPGLEYSSPQLMYIAFAQDSCSVLSKEVERELYTSKPHSVQKLRILNVLQNSKMFLESFNCSAKIMNPQNECIFFE